MHRSALPSKLNYLAIALTAFVLAGCGSSSSAPPAEENTTPDQNVITNPFAQPGNEQVTGDGAVVGNNQVPGDGTVAGENQMVSNDPVSPDQTITGSDTLNGSTDSAGLFDMADYTFHINTRTVGGSIAFTEKTYNKTLIDQGPLISLPRSFTNNAGVIEEAGFGINIKTFTITDTTIEERFLDDGTLRTWTRFANIGDVYMDEDVQTGTTALFPGLSGPQNASCQLLEHLPTFDLSTATGEEMLASGSYQDVIKIRCITSNIVEGQRVPHTDLVSYLAQDIGLLLSEGSVLLFGDQYIIEEY